jgi:transmembrane sensor
MSDKNIDWEKLEQYLAGDHGVVLNEDEQAMALLMTELKTKQALLGAVANTDPKAAWELFRQNHIRENVPVVKRILPWKKWAIAAAVTGIVAIGGLLLLKKPGEENTAITRIVEPAVDKVTLVLPDNKKIILDSVTGSIRQGFVNIDLQNESAVFSATENATTTAYNTILVPRGKKFQLRLEDGTRVWLNADSRLRFPVKFTSEARQVEIEGEGYFEVAHAAERPFTVNYHNNAVRVLGTRFNIHAYGEEEAVTLLQGSIEWTGLQRSIQLNPGQQVQVNAGNVATRQVKADDYILWINNTLLLEQKSVQHLFNDIVRHYDVEVRYAATIPDSIKFNGAFEFPPTLDQMLSLMNSTGKVIAEKKENYVMVSPKTR